MATNKARHILVVRLSAMGDVAMTVPVLLSLTKSYPTLKVTVLTKPFFVPIFKDLPQVEVVSAEIDQKHKGLWGLWRLFSELKRKDVDAIADFHNVLRSNILRVYFRFAGIPFVQIDKGRREKKELTRWTEKEIHQLKTTYQRYCDVFERLGYPIRLEKDDVLPKGKMPITLSNMLDPKRALIGIAPFAAYEGKTYPEKSMLKLLELLDAQGSYQLLLFGSPGRQADRLQSWCDAMDHAINMAGKHSFSEELDVISNLTLMLSMDSGNAHLAAMYGVPVITLWGVTHPFAGFYPYGQPLSNALLADRNIYPFIPTSVYGNKMPEGYQRALETVTPDSIVEKIERLIQGG